MDRHRVLIQLCIILWLWVSATTALLTFQAGRFNAARGRLTQQSSGFWPSSRAVDGDDGKDLKTCTHTHPAQHTFWSVNLQIVYTIYSVTLTNRGDCCGNRLSNFAIYGSNTGFYPTQVTDLVLCNSQSYAMGTAETKTFNCNRGSNNFIDAQYIIVNKTSANNDPLTLCEVQVEAACDPHHCKDGTICRSDNGFCSDGCEPGYTGDRCINECPDGQYGYPCKQCSANCLNNQCYMMTDTGYCVNDECIPGYVYGPECKTECAPGSYGSNCVASCSSTCAAGTTCDRVDGHCLEGCKSGNTGNMCEDQCEDGMYGDRCRLACSPNCQNPVCDKFSDIGKCQDGCKAGFKGENCTNVCEAGKYGENCVNDCSGHCKSHDTCSRIDGGCPSGCSRGYIGQTCAEKCTDFTYGDNCVYDCSQHCVNPCNKTSETGSCGGDCEPGYKGDNCTHECVQGDACHSPEGLEQPPVGGVPVSAIAGALAAVILVAVIIIVIIFVFRRRRSRGNPKDDKATVEDDQPVPNHVYTNALMKTQDESVVDTTKKPSRFTKLKNKPDVEHKPTTKPKPATLKRQTEENKNTYANADTKEEKVVKVAKPVMSVKPTTKPKPASKILSVSDETENSMYANVVTTLPTLSSATMVKTSDFAKYVNDAKLAEDPFKDEYENIPKQMESWDKANAANLKIKNRYKNILPYDNNSITLKQVGNDPLSTYINASFINDYLGHKAYIAALGTTEHTLGDFWRMIWEYDITLIVMVTKLTEDGKIKCIQYWPDEGSVKYGDISITFENCKEQRTYTIRKLKAEKDSEIRSITHYNYTAWPDKGVPESVPSIVHIRDIMKKYKTQNKDKPILVHCSAGVGRTGTVIALDILLDQAENENQVDVRMCVSTLRKQRGHLVQTLAQYVFIHDAMNEILSVGYTMVHPEKLQSLLANEQELKTQYKFLENVKPQFNDDEMQLGKYEQDKNRDNHIIPADHRRVKILSSPEVYFNGVYVEGYNSSTEYIATQTPLESTASDFWRMIYEEECKLVVCLQTDPDYKNWFASEKSSLRFDKLISTTTHIDVGDSVNKYGVTVSRYVETEYANMNTGDGNGEVNLHLFVLNDSAKKNLSTKMNHLLKEVEKSKGKSKRGIVLCLNGCTLTGQYIALSTLYDMVQREQQMDVFTIVKQMRKNRPQFIQTQDQYIFLHQTLQEICSSSAEYEDLSATSKRKSFQTIL